MISISPLNLRFIRNYYSARNFLKIFHNLGRARGVLKNDYRPAVAVAVQSLQLRRFPVISPTSHCASVGLSVAVRFSRMTSGGGDGCQMVEFQLSESIVLKIQKGDITAWSIDGSSDAIVNPANERMLGGGGADGAIHQAAGSELRAACYEVPEVWPGVRCPTGEARITRGFRLPASHVIHTVGPIYSTNKNPEASLRNAYRNSLRVAKDNSIQYIAFTAISCGVYGYPYDEAATVAISTIKEFAKDIKEFPLMLLGGSSIAKFFGCLTGKSCRNGKSSSSSINEPFGYVGHGDYSMNEKKCALCSVLR